MTLSTLRKMSSSVEDGSSVQYSMHLGNEQHQLNALIGQTVSLKFTGNIYCINCKKKSNKSFSQGYCYSCFIKLAACDSCIMSPEKCHYHLGTCREPEWGEKYCMQSHYVYLANSSGLKVGITRGDQLPTRWIDQGAVQGRPIFTVKNRHTSGLMETLFKTQVADKTNWRTMLKGNAEMLDLEYEQERLINLLSSELDSLMNSLSLDAIVDLTDRNETHFFDYPVLEFPQKIVSLNAEKTPLVEGTLLGIKGQYWLLDNGVINIRKYTGYEAELKS